MPPPSADPGRGRRSCQRPTGRPRRVASRGGVASTAPACARAAGSRRVLIKLATVVTVSTIPMTISDTAVLISGTLGSSHQEEQCPQTEQGERVGREDDVGLVGDAGGG